MIAVRSDKLRKIVGVGLLLLMSLGSVVCLSQAAPFDHVNGSSTRQESDVSLHPGLGLHCLMTVLPMALFLVFLRVVIFYTILWAPVRILPALPLFIPPENVYVC